ncbi:MAG: tetraacyldisaccharide 4'-kinase [Alphaproteobacteria bacterium]|nr:tetraacyldisaccharide 4'-kinase [Alphaproteobacteria bacterium]
MRAPEFWHRDPGLLAALLTPASAVWSCAASLHATLSRPYRAPIPVACVGNLVAGGSGKTPVAISLTRSLTERGIAAHIVSRGYGAALTGVVRVRPEAHDAEAVGDEHLLLARDAPCWIGRDRAMTIRAAVAAGAEAILLDDGYQNPTVAKDFSLLVVDAAYRFGNGHVIPAGPLRERIETGLARADAIVWLDSPAEPGREPPSHIANGGPPVLRASLVPLLGDRLAGEAFYAFAGIGRPEKFFAAFRALGARLVGTRSFPDHHRFRAGEIEDLRREAARRNARLITTAKDMARLRGTQRAGIDVLEVEIRWHDPAAVSALVSGFAVSAGDGRQQS